MRFSLFSFIDSPDVFKFLFLFTNILVPARLAAVLYLVLSTFAPYFLTAAFSIILPILVSSAKSIAPPPDSAFVLIISVNPLKTFLSTVADTV